MKPTERLKNQPTKKPYSPQVSRKTTTFYLHEISWQKQLKKAISNWTFGCDAPQKIGKTAVMECKRNCKRKTTYEYNACTLLAFIFFIIINIRKFRQLKSLILDEGQTGQLVQDLVFDSWCPYGFLKKVEDKHFLMNWLFGGREITLLNYRMDKTLLGFTVNTVTLHSKSYVLLHLFGKVANLQQITFSLHWDKSVWTMYTCFFLLKILGFLNNFQLFLHILNPIMQQN